MQLDMQELVLSYLKNLLIPILTYCDASAGLVTSYIHPPQPEIFNTFPCHFTQRTTEHSHVKLP